MSLASEIMIFLTFILVAIGSIVSIGILIKGIMNATKARNKEYIEQETKKLQLKIKKIEARMKLTNDEAIKADYQERIDELFEQIEKIQKPFKK